MKFAVFTLFFALPLALLAQQDPAVAAAPRPNISIKKTTAPLRLDGTLDEPIWQSAQMVTGFHRQFPTDTGLVREQTEVKVCFDDRNLYLAAICWQPRSTYTTQSLRRDFAPGTSDVLNVLLDPSKDGLNGFIFGISPFSVQREALVSNGTTLSYEWDNKWESAVRNYDDHWVVELAIPFKTLRYTVSPGTNTWHVNFIRTRLHEFEVGTWVSVPLIFSPNNLAFTGDLLWESPPPKPGLNLSAIPYVTGRYAQNYVRQQGTNALLERRDKTGGSLGGDVKVAVTSGLNLDLTVNPDFSQVEVDRQVANLSRFELFFPELRQSFLENRDLFAMFGFPNTRPFFSRRIGLAYNNASRQYERVPILAGARLSGKLNDAWRIGLLNMQTGKKEFSEGNVQPAANFGVLTAQRRVLKRSTMSGILVNKQNLLGGLSDAERGDRQPWNRVAGLEFNLYSQDNRWEGETYSHRSFSPDPAQRGSTLAQFMGYNDRRISLSLGYNRVDSNYTAEAGFVPRPGVQNLYTGAGLLFYPKSAWGARKLSNSKLSISGDQTFSLRGQETDRYVSLNFDVSFKDQTVLTLGAYNAYTYLFDEFDPTYLAEADEKPLDAKRGYTYNGLRADLFTSTSYDWQTQLSINVGQYFTGDIRSAEGSLVYRYQPYGTFSLQYSFNSIRLPEPYVSADFWLIGPRLEFAFTRKLFTSAFFQYNTQANNLNVNARLQWRFAPASDLFFVYTDNSFAQAVPYNAARFLLPKNKTIVLKAVYWLNV